MRSERRGDRVGFRGWNEQAHFAAARRRRHVRQWLGFTAIWGAAALAGTAYGAGWLDGLWQRHSASHAEGSGVRANFSMCLIGGGYNCVVDGDTIWLEGHKIRIADIDAPETHDPRCQSEKELGDRATLRLQQLLDSGTVSLQAINRDKDVYGRELRLVLVDGRSVGDTLVSEGLARWYEGSRRPWC